MSHIQNKHRPANFLSRLLKWPLLCGLLSFALARMAWATDPYAPEDIYGGTNAIYNYTIPGNPPPQFDATNFIINNSFTVNWEILNVNTPLFEPQNTVNYINNGSMVSDTGFRFDTQTSGGHQMAGSFYNSGDIQCGSFNNFIFLIGLGEMIVSATNIVNPAGTIEVGEDGLMQLTGGNVDLSRSGLTIEGGTGNAFGSGGFGLDTNAEWNPFADLGPTYAFSSLPFILDLFASTPYFNFASPNPSNNVIRTVFVQDASTTNVSYNVYFDTAGIGVGGGNATVEWVGAYRDPITGNQTTNYLYLNDDYLLGASTNVAIFNGYPDNFTFTESATPLIFTAPTAAGFFNVFPDVAFSNRYAYASVQLVPTTVQTNSPSQNVTNYLSILAGRMQITATKNLKMNFANIDGPNYLSLVATNQFDGSAGATISSPYSDISLGVTNGFMTVSNLLEPLLPRWQGTVQAWSTRWLTPFTNTTITIDTNGVATTNSVVGTNDFRVELVSSQLSPTSPSEIQHLALHATNSLVISDVLNVFSSIFIDANSLTLTTNDVSAASTDGELNLQNSDIFFASSIPNLRNLTNNGAIRTGNLLVFGAPTNGLSFINNGLVSDNGSQIYANTFLNSGIIANGIGSFALQSLTTTLTNGSITAGGDMAITTGSLVASNVVLSAGKTLTLTATNLLTDTGPSPTNGNLWSVGGGIGNNGMNLLIKPTIGDLLGTTITNNAPLNKNVNNIWAGKDFGVSTAGYTNNAAIGRLILDAVGIPTAHTLFTFNSAGASNAIYVDYLELRDFATNRVNGDVSALAFNNVVIYYAQAIINGVSVAEKLNTKNGNHLRWVPAYAGYYSSTNIVVNGVTNTVNTALAESTDIDSDGDGIDNAFDPTPFFTPSSVNFTMTVTNVPPLTAFLKWQTMPDATNYVLFKTNLLSANYLVLTNFVTPPAPPFAPITNTISDPVNPTAPRFYRVRVDPNSTDLYGP